MIQITSISETTASRLNLAVNDWLKGWPEDRILNVQVIYKDRAMEPYIAFITYMK